MAVNPQFLVAAVDLSEVFLDKDTGAPLSGGQIFFYRDIDRVTQKLVYTIQNNNPALPPNYSYIPLPNPITLSASGQFQDNNGNNIPVYYYPVFGPNNDLDLYYIVVTNSQGTQQFIRQAWPPNESSVQPPPAFAANPISNQITNSQFIDVNFSLAHVLVGTTVGYTLAYAAGVTTINIAPGWNLVITAVAAGGNIDIGRTPVAGSSAFSSNPPYMLYVLPGANITNLQLIQTLQNNPDIFSPQPLGANGYLSASFLLGPNSTAISMSYIPNGQPSQNILLPQTNATGAPVQYNQTTQLQPATNPFTGDTGSVNIVINLNTTLATTISNIQIVPLNSNIGGIPYDQRTANRERDFEFNIYKQPLFNKPINSYLIGWDFPLNPTQESGNGTIAASADGANTSQQTWDQTVLFQNTNNGAASSRSASGSGAMTITATNATQFAIVQYLPQAIAREILQNSALSVNVAATTNGAYTLAGTVALYYTTDGALPHTAANNSLIATITPGGKAATFNGNWTEINRGNLGDAVFTVTQSATTNWNDYLFSGWSLNGGAAVNTATFFAIVVGFAQLGIGNSIDFGSISLVPGSIPTRPAPKTKSEVLIDCQAFYESSFPSGVAPARQMNLGTSTWSVLPSVNRAAHFFVADVPFKVVKNSSPLAAAVTFYNPVNNDALVYNITTAASMTATAVAENGAGVNAIGPNGFSIEADDINSRTGDFVAVNWSVDVRLGL